MKFILRYRVLILLISVILTAFFGVQIKKLTRDAGVSTLVATDHPDYLYWKETEEIFGATDQVVVGVSSEQGVYDIETLRFIHELTVFFEEQDEIDEDDVVSLTNVDDMRGEESELLIEPLIEADDIDTLDAEDLAEIREKVRSNPLFFERLVSPDEHSAAVVAGVLTAISTKEEKMAALKHKVVIKLTELQQRFPSVQADLSGPAMLKAFITEYMQKDMRRLFPFAMVVVMLMLTFLLRSIYGMIVPILVTVFSILWTLGLKGLLHSPLTIVETTIPVMLIAIACADGVHIISEFFGFYRRGLSAQEALTQTMRILTLPVILTSVTTSLGFISLISAPGISIKNMGIFLAFGVMVAMVFSLCFIPALTSFYRKKLVAPAPGAKDNEHSRFQQLSAKIGEGIIRHKLVVVAIAALFLALSVLGLFNIQVESDEIRYFKKNNPFRLATERIQERLGGVTSLDIVFEGPYADSMKEPRILHAIWDLQKFCEQQELVSYSMSPADFIRRINYVLHDNDPAYERLPKDTETVRYEGYEESDGIDTLVEKSEEVKGSDLTAQYLLLYEMGGGESIDEYVDANYQIARISVRLKDMSSRRLTALLKTIKPYIAVHIPANVTVRYSNHYIRAVMMGLIIDSQIISLLTVLTTITILMSLMFRSVLVGLITAIPVFIAVLFNFAVMWFSGVTLNIGTSIIASVGMGVGIDYAIHYFSRFRLLFYEQTDYDRAIVKAIRETSRAILSNAAAVGLGFLVLFFSEYRVVAGIGWITALSMLTTALSSLIVLPAILSLVKPKIRGVK